MRVEIITPDKELFKGEATSVTVPGVDGSLGFLNNHAPLITVLKAGDVKLRTEKGEQIFPVKGGVVEVSKNTVIVLAEGSEISDPYSLRFYERRLSGAVLLFHVRHPVTHPRVFRKSRLPENEQTHHGHALTTRTCPCAVPIVHHQRCVRTIHPRPPRGARVRIHRIDPAGRWPFGDP
ncbi:MAG: ATP synthase F1 subunit epsilon [Flavobacteriales bacterium]|nr:ATP synthase F1 subunit epsilon [Flavobacteriales bacterium]